MGHCQKCVFINEDAGEFITISKYPTPNIVVIAHACVLFLIHSTMDLTRSVWSE